MSLAITYTRANLGVSAPLVTVETHLTNGLPGMSIVGLPEMAVKEAKDRVRSAILNCGFDFPARRITVNLAPADLPKEGGRYDLAIAMGILAASGQVSDSQLGTYEFFAELALSGVFRPCLGTLPAVIQCREAHRTAVVAAPNLAEASLITGLRVMSPGSLTALVEQLNGQQPVVYCESPDKELTSVLDVAEDMAAVKGQFQAKRALEVAAAGEHNILFYGPPGTGKTMLANRLPGILPPLNETEALSAAAVRSVAGLTPDLQGWKQRTFRSPHHTASAAALVGGGSTPRPGEISLAHHGVLFLDELPEFDRKVLEVLREPLESGEIVISRAARQTTFPAKFQLLAAMNPCPCGYAGHPQIPCQCTDQAKARYRNKISGPLLDRFDLHVEVPAMSISELQSEATGEQSGTIRKRVIAARALAERRQGVSNQRLQNEALARMCALSEENRALLDGALQKLGMSARAYHRVLRVARTIADLQLEETIRSTHLLEALSLRSLDRRPTPQV